MYISACGASYKGNVRSHNEDNIYVDGQYRDNTTMDVFLIESDRESGPFLYAVFDGLGGESCGEVASLTAADILRQAEQTCNGSAIDFDDYLVKADKAIRQGAEEQGVRTMGTTVAIAHIDEKAAAIYNIGDSRAYLFRDDNLSQLTKDHSVVQSMIDLGFLSEEDRYNNPHSGELTQYLGMTSEEDIEPSADSTTFTPKRNDILLLCSDGLYSELGDETIAGQLKRSKDMEPKYIVTDLLMTAKEGKCLDNVSAIIVKFE